MVVFIILLVGIIQAYVNLAEFGGPSHGNPKIQWYETQLDYSGQVRGQTFAMRYIIDDQYFKRGSKAPILFYCGNEADIFMFYNSSGFQSETLAQKFGGIVVYAEHRYFGESIPKSDKDKKYLTLENAMMDYVNLIEKIKHQYKTEHAVTFGGSYGGMLAAWLRMKFPDRVTAAVVSGGPILYFKGSKETPESIFF